MKNILFVASIILLNSTVSFAQFNITINAKDSCLSTFCQDYFQLSVTLEDSVAYYREEDSKIEFSLDGLVWYKQTYNDAVDIYDHPYYTLNDNINMNKSMNLLKIFSQNPNLIDSIGGMGRNVYCRYTMTVEKPFYTFHVKYSNIDTLWLPSPTVDDKEALYALTHSKIHLISFNLFFLSIYDQDEAANISQLYPDTIISDMINVLLRSGKIKSSPPQTEEEKLTEKNYLSTFLNSNSILVREYAKWFIEGHYLN